MSMKEVPQEAEIISFVVDPQEVGERLDRVLVRRLQGPSRGFVGRLIDEEYVTINTKNVKAAHRLREGECVEVHIPRAWRGPQRADAEDVALDIFYQDPHLMVIHKPIGMAVHPTPGRLSGTLVNALLHHAVSLSDGSDPLRPGIVHRLDKETSGLILVAKDNVTHARLARLFQQRRVFKRYVALVEGLVEFDEGRIDAPIGAHVRFHEKKQVRYDHASSREAVTRYEVLERGRDRTLVALYPKTGRTHQLRVHMKHLGHPILGDTKYGKAESFSRLALHAQIIGFPHPWTKAYMEFVSRVPSLFSVKK